MKMKMNIVILLFLIIFVFSVGSIFAKNEKKLVIVSIPPQAFFVKEIAGDCVDVLIMIPDGANPITYEPKSSQMVAMSKASIYFSIGVPFEKVWLKRIFVANSKINIVNTDVGIPKILMERRCLDVDVGCDGFNKNKFNLIRFSKSNYCCGLEDPHVWTSPELVKIVAKNMTNTLVEIDPNNSLIFINNLMKFEKKIDKLHDEILLLFRGKKNIEFIVYHPSWGYFARSYNLKQIAVEVDGKSPKPAYLDRLIRYALKNNINVVFAQPQFSKVSAKLIADAIDGELKIADPLAYEWFENLRNQAKQFSLSMK